MKKLILFVLLLFLVSSIAFSVSFQSKTTIENAPKKLLVDNNLLSGYKDFKYTVSVGPVTSGDFTDGPVITYVTNIISGEIYLDRPSKVLAESGKYGTRFTLRAVCDDEGKDCKIFRGCVVKKVNRINMGSGKTQHVYIFNATSLQIQ